MRKTHCDILPFVVALANVGNQGLFGHPALVFSVHQPFTLPAYFPRSWKGQPEHAERAGGDFKYFPEDCPQVAEDRKLVSVTRQDKSVRDTAQGI